MITFQKPDIINKPDFIETLQREGFEIRKNKISCPFHHDKYPSYIIYGKHGHCFGCGWHGDVIQFIMDYKKVSFKEACRYLGISNSKPYKPDPRQIKKRELVKGFSQWCNSYYDDLCEFYRLWNDIKARIKTIEEAEKYAEFYHREPIITYQMDILFSNDNEAKYEIYKEVIYAD